MHRALITASLAIALVSTASPARAGDLTPPPGPVTPTDRVTIHGPTATLPITIDEPGSYVLTGNVTGVAGQHGIVIASDNVTLDLNGFTLTGVEGSRSGIRVSGAHTAISVANGTVTGWAEGGVILDTANAADLRDLTAHGNTGDGIATGDNAVLTRCRAISNTTGFDVEDGCVLTDCVASNNALIGAALGIGSSATRVTARANGNRGIDGLAKCRVDSCTVTDNIAEGVHVSGQASVTNNHIASNNGAGIRTPGTFSVIARNTLSFNNIGIEATTVGNTVYNNVVTLSLTGNNYLLASGNTVGVIIDATGGTTISSTQPWANISN